MLKSLARLHTTGQLYVGRMLGRAPQVRRMLPVDPRRGAISKLSHLRRSGAALLSGARGNLFTSGLRAWESRVVRWTNDVIEAIEPISKDDALWFGAPDILPLASMPIPGVRVRSKDDLERFTEVFYRHAHRLERLRDLLARYGVVDAQPGDAEAATAAPLQAIRHSPFA
jgi:hypothetical protein